MRTSVVFPARSAAALGYLKAAANDIEVFVEDSACPNMWVKLLRNFLPDGTKLNSVNILGSRKNVLAACRADQQDDNRKKIYIIDADLDIILKAPKPRLKYLYRLKSYCSENYLINEDSLTEVSTYFDTECSAAVAQMKLGYEDWFVQNGALLEKLFAYYAAASVLAPGTKTVSFSVYKLQEEGGNEFNLCPRKVNQRIFEVTRILLAAAPKGEVRSVLSACSDVAGKATAMHSVSGKDYLLPLIFERVKRKFGVSVNRNVFKVMLASHVKPERDRWLAARLKKLVES